MVFTASDYGIGFRSENFRGFFEKDLNDPEIKTQTWKDLISPQNEGLREGLEALTWEHPFTKRTKPQ